ncbi:hypothetical protein SCHPADRAFT_243728 [Schizopora paradoxa]|uniref:Uncharacterized protein n=1 Tax=Schizopora paradoxa TaxID=27342 RepID=A0A0H2RVA9_9AGAM|nr:hypothetical protein SCHPADRAFT_243728 [Schizopora paradoxa]
MLLRLQFLWMKTWQQLVQTLQRINRNSLLEGRNLLHQIGNLWTAVNWTRRIFSLTQIPPCYPRASTRRLEGRLEDLMFEIQRVREDILKESPRAPDDSSNEAPPSYVNGAGRAQ